MSNHQHDSACAEASVVFTSVSSPVVFYAKNAVHIYIASYSCSSQSTCVCLCVLSQLIHTCACKLTVHCFMDQFVPGMLSLGGQRGLDTEIFGLIVSHLGLNFGLILP